MMRRVRRFTPEPQRCRPVTMTIHPGPVGLTSKHGPDSLDSYRIMGPDFHAGEVIEPCVLVQMQRGVSLVWNIVFAGKYDPSRTASACDYQAMFEFFQGRNAAVAATYADLTVTGFMGGRRRS